MKMFLLSLIIILMTTNVWASVPAQYVPDLVISNPGAIWTDIRAYTITPGKSKLQNALAAVGTTIPSTILVPENVTLLGNTIIPANVILKVTPGHTISTTPYTLTINGILDVPRQQCFNAPYNKVFIYGGNNAIYPEWWGAVVNDGKDDLAAINAAMVSNKLASDNIPIELYPGVYNVTGAIKVESFDTLRGTGNKIASTSIVESIASSNIINIDAQASYVLIERINFDYASQPTSNATAINLKSIEGGSYSINIHNVHIRQCVYGIYFETVFSANITDVNIDRYTKSAVYMNTCKDVHLDHFIFSGGNCYSGDPLHPCSPVINNKGSLGAIRLVNSNEAIIISNGDIVLSQIALYITSTSPSAPLAGTCPGNSIFTNVFFDSAYTCAGLIEFGNGLLFQSCWFTTNKSFNGTGLYVHAGHNIMINGCFFNETGGPGITFVNGVHGISVIGCDIKDCGANSANPGINVGPGTTDFTIANNRISDDGDGHMNYGICINSGTSNNYIVTNNRIHGASIAAFIDGGSGVNKIVTPNLSW
jgi:hypothetical protein